MGFELNWKPCALGLRCRWQWPGLSLKRQSVFYGAGMEPVQTSAAEDSRSLGRRSDWERRSLAVAEHAFCESSLSVFVETYPVVGGGVDIQIQMPRIVG